MSKLLSFDNEWFQESVPRLEDNLESAVLAYLESLFPDYITTFFKQTLRNPYIQNRTNAADLAMFKRDYSEWFIIEVELARHDLDHVVNQIETFTSFVPTIANADYVYEQRKRDFDKERLRLLVTTITPKTMVIVNKLIPEWKEELNKFNCKLCVFQIYKDFNSNRIYRIDGDYPVVSAHFCYCRLQKTVLGTIEVLDAQFLNLFNIQNNQTLEIIFNGKSSVWKRVDSGLKVFLMNDDTIPVLDPDSNRYRLHYYGRERGKPKRSAIIEWFFGVPNPLPRINTFTFIRD